MARARTATGSVTTLSCVAHPYSLLLSHILCLSLPFLFTFTLHKPNSSSAKVGLHPGVLSHFVALPSLQCFVVAAEGRGRKGKEGNMRYVAQKEDDETGYESTNEAI